MSVVFFTDRDLGLQFPDILRTAGLSVERHVDHFKPDTEDTVWLPTAAGHGWVTLTHDARIRYKPNELAAVIKHRATVLVMVGKAPFSELARNFVTTLPGVLAFLGAHSTPPVIGKVYRPTPSEIARNPEAVGRVELWYPRAKRL